MVETSADFTVLSGPLRVFDGILAVGTEGGEVYLVDLNQQLLDDVVVGVTEVKDEVNPSFVAIITKMDLDQIEDQKELNLQNQEHLSIHLNGMYAYF